jgi:hypothetical protein
LKGFLSIILFCSGLGVLYGQPNTPRLYVEVVENEYHVKFQNGSETKIILALPVNPTIVRIAPDLFSIFFSVGNPANYTYFYETQKQELSKPFFLVIAFDPVGKTVLYSGKGVFVEEMFDSKSIVKIEADFSESVTPYTIISEPKIEENRVSFKYLSGNNYEEKEYSGRF